MSARCCGRRWQGTSRASPASFPRGPSERTAISPLRQTSRLGPQRAIPAFPESLDLNDVTLVSNDTGGVLCIAALATRHPGLDRIGRFVLTNCDSYEHFPPKGFDRIAALASRLPPAVPLMLRGCVSGPGLKYFLKSACVRPPDAGLRPPSSNSSRSARTPAAKPSRLPAHSSRRSPSRRSAPSEPSPGRYSSPGATTTSSYRSTTRGV